MNKAVINALGSYAVVLLLSACVTDSGTNRAGIHGAFFTGPRTLTGTYEQFEDHLSQAIPEPADTTLIIFNHGTTQAGLGQVCEPVEHVPDPIRHAPIHLKDTISYYFCSNEVGSNSRASTSRQTFIKRGAEISRLLDRFLAHGVPADRIMLAGQSGGASAILSTSVIAPEKFNAFIAVAPGYGYAYLNRSIHDPVLSKRYQAWKSHYLSVNRHNGLVYGFGNDEYAPIKDMAFLRDVSGIELTEVRNASCRGENPHFYFYTSCFSKHHLRSFYEYIAGKLDDVGIKSAYLGKPSHLAEHSDVDICRYAVTFFGQWETHDRWGKHVEEARNRGLSPESCLQIIKGENETVAHHLNQQNDQLVSENEDSLLVRTIPDTIAKSDRFICTFALRYLPSSTSYTWETEGTYASYAQEAQKRNLTIQECENLKI